MRIERGRPATVGAASGAQGSGRVGGVSVAADRLHCLFRSNGAGLHGVPDRASSVEGEVDAIGRADMAANPGVRSTCLGSRQSLPGRQDRRVDHRRYDRPVRYDRRKFLKSNGLQIRCYSSDSLCRDGEDANCILRHGQKGGHLALCARPGSVRGRKRSSVRLGDSPCSRLSCRVIVPGNLGIRDKLAGPCLLYFTDFH